MKREKHVILAVHLHQRAKQALQVQKVFTQYGANIKTRLGLHEVGDKENAPGGVIILEMIGKPAEITAFGKKLSGIKGVELKKITFEHS